MKTKYVLSLDLEEHRKEASTEKKAYAFHELSNPRNES